jgi:hypothetical protein
MTIFGSDVSHFDSPDTRKMLSQGIVFQTHKAGGDADDAELHNWWNLVKTFRSTVLLGAYWVLYPGTPAARADRFLARLDDQCPGWRDGPFILQVDCEKWHNDTSTVPPVSDINAFCDRLAAKCPKLNPIVYAPDWVYGNKVAALRYPIWASSYVNGTGTPTFLYPGDDSEHWHAYGGKEPSILQFSSSATMGGQTTCDANAFRGTLNELAALLAPDWVRPPKEIDVELTDKYGDAAWPGRDVADRFNDDAKLRDVLWGDAKGTDAADLPAGSPLAKLIAVPARLDQIEAQLAAAASGGVTQEQLNTAVYAALKQLAADANQ